MTIKDAILRLVEMEKNLEQKCFMLTAIGTSSEVKAVFAACEEIRNELTESCGEVSQASRA